MGRETEDGKRRTGRRPNFSVLEQIFVNDGDRRADMSRGGYAADGEAGVLAHEIGVRLDDGLVQRPAYFLHVDAIAAASENEDGPLSVARLENQRFDDLCHVAANSLGRLLRRARRIGKFYNLSVDAVCIQNVLNALSTLA